jgi:hypothetical protein
MMKAQKQHKLFTLVCPPYQETKLLACSSLDFLNGGYDQVSTHNIGTQKTVTLFSATTRKANITQKQSWRG